MDDVGHYESVSKNTTQLEACSGVLGYLCVPEDFGLLYFLLSHDYRAAGSPMSEHRAPKQGPAPPSDPCSTHPVPCSRQTLPRSFSGKLFHTWVERELTRFEAFP